MAISRIDYSNTFSHWLISTNQLIDNVNTLNTGNFYKSDGTLYLNSPGAGLSVANSAAFSGNTIFSGSSSINYIKIQVPTIASETITINSPQSIVASGNIAANGFITVNGFITSNSYIWTPNTFSEYLTVNNSIVFNTNNAIIKNINDGQLYLIASQKDLNDTNTFLQANDGITLASARAYTDAANTYNTTRTDNANTFLQANDGITLTSARTYTDAANTYNTTRTDNANTFLQANDGITLTSARTYTDAANTFLRANDGITLAAGKSYTDAANTFLRANDGITLAAARAYTDLANTFLRANDGITLTTAVTLSKDYANNNFLKVTSGNVVSTSVTQFNGIQVDNLTASNVSILGTFTNLGSTTSDGNEYLFLANSGTPTSANTNIIVNRGIGANAVIRWYNVGRYWQIKDVNTNTFYQITTQQELDAANTFLRANDGLTLAAARTYTDAANTYNTTLLSTANTSLRANDGITLAAARAYTDAANTFLQANDGITLAAAKTYTDAANTFLRANDGITLASAKTYTDAANTYNTTLLSTANTSLRANDGITLAAARAYTDAANTYNTTRTDNANTFLQANDGITLTSAKTYTDNANTFLQANDGITLTSAKTYTDTANTYLKAYIDNKTNFISGGQIITFGNDVIVSGNLSVQGQTTTINSTTVKVNDKNLELANVTNPTNATADGAGLTVLGSTNKTLNWINSTQSWTSSESFDIVSGKAYTIAGTTVLTATTLGSGITASSLTGVGNITSGTWSGAFGTVSGANLTNLTAANLTGTIPSGVLGNSTQYIGTTAITLNRASGAQTLNGVSIDGNAATATSSPLLSAKPNYWWVAESLPGDYALGVQSSFVRAADGWSEYGSVVTVNTYAGGGGALQLYTPYGPSNGGNALKVRFGNYDVNGGNSWTAWKTLLQSDNYNSYAPTLTGTGASGTWSINISGTAATASSVAWANVSGRPSNVSAFTNDSAYITTAGRAYPRRNNDGGDLNFNWSGQTGQPSWLWGGNDGTNMYVYNPSNFSVNYATTAGSAGALTGGWTSDTLRAWSTLTGIPANVSGLNQSVATTATPTFANLTVGTSTVSYITMIDSDEGKRIIHCNSNRIGFLTQLGDWGSWCEDDGSWVSVGNVTAYSDARLKTDLNPIENALDKVNHLTGYTYTRIDSGAKQTGLLAQELQKVLPEAVVEANDEDKTLSIAYGNVVGLLVEAIKELKQEIELLKQGK